MQWFAVIKKARNCHSRQSWQLFVEEFGEDLSSTNDSKPIAEIFKILTDDSHSLKYGESLWQCLLSGCISSWNLSLGCEIASFVEKIPSAAIRLKIAEIFMESGLPSQARKVSQRSLRLKSINQADIISFQLVTCKSYVEEGRHTMARRMLEKLESSVSTTNLPSETKADMLLNIARSKFFLGNYTEAAFLFSRAYRIYRFHKRWESAACALFNSAASYDNSGMDYREKAMSLVAKCQQMSIKHSLPGPLSHCYAFHATYLHHRGSFSESVDYYRKALRLIPSSENRFRKLHIISMLTFTLYKAGKFKLAAKYGRQTLKLAEEDESERFKIRYITLKAELDWQEGHVMEAYQLLAQAIKPLEANGIHTLEELSALSRFNIKSAQLNTPVNYSVKIARSLKNNNATWLEYRISKAFQMIVRGDIDESYHEARMSLQDALEHGFTYYEAQSLCVLLLAKVRSTTWDDEFDQFCQSLEGLATSNDFKVFLTQVLLAKASRAYYEGDFETAAKLISDALRLPRLSIQKDEVLGTWRQTISGNAPRFNHGWKAQFVIATTKTYFKPSFRCLGTAKYIVSERYVVSLEDTPILNKLTQYLLGQEGFSASPEEIQVNVWQQKTNLQGWQQKIRNSITRLRALFPQTIAPLILYEGNAVRLFSEAIEIQPIAEKANYDQKILELLQKGPQSSIQLANSIQVSQSTTKRILRKLVDGRQVTQSKVGRKVLYSRHAFDFRGLRSSESL
ncbi:ArsR family transcriptional regulator [Pseudobacteriovorax antillogorgiicola]|uniref:Regulatory protein, arsR family n=1 Tax=Pseudobacteriovorax antillogorgiicola TaxID=1513793 RepID=A0A1Y6B9I1_9BACT|nr:ArsR family transcriptional regulator [Pseudobacteriovorax antillogorgiicola]TCS59390.1 regulatory ArsR family protein [Pseudobacteriovorax antillogorgiicola]SME88713.1 regulatory protein, arsR family [Pseudobacteriovorax antillogorgiicola]